MSTFADADAFIAENFRADMSDEDLLALVQAECAMVYAPGDIIHSLWRLGGVAEQKESLDRLRARWIEETRHAEEPDQSAN